MLALGGGTVFFPVGIYRVDSPIYVLGSNVHLVGAGDATEIRIHSTYHPAIRIGNNGSGDCAQNTCSGNMVRNLTISRAGVPTVGANAVDVRVAMYTTLDRLAIHNHDIAIRVGVPPTGINVSTDNNWYTMMTNIRFIDMTTAGVWYDSAANSIIRDCYFGALRGSQAIGVVMDHDSNGIWIQNVVMIAEWRYHIYSTGSQGFARWITDSVLEHAREAEIVLGGSGIRDVRIANVWMSGGNTYPPGDPQAGQPVQSPGANGIFGSNVRDVQITNCVIKNQPNAAITLSNLEEVLISGNILTGNVGVSAGNIASMYLVGGYNVSVTGNRVASGTDNCSIRTTGSRFIVKDNLSGDSGPNNICSTGTTVSVISDNL